MNYDLKKVGQRIRKERKGAGFKTQGDFAKRMGYHEESRQTIGNWENGKILPRLDDLLKMCEIFNCELGYLLCEYNCKTRENTDIQAVTGLSEEAISSLLNLAKNSGTDEKLSVLSQILAHEKLSDFLKAIEAYSITVNENLYRPVITEEDELVATFFNCEPSNARYYLEAYSVSVIQSMIMKIVQDVKGV